MDRNRIAKENQYFLKDLETMTREDMKKLQFEKTKETLERAYNKSEFYRELFDKAKVKPEDFKILEDIARFPFIDKKDLIKDQEENPPFGRRVCVLPDELRRVNLTSGTSGMGQEVHCHDEDAIWASNASTATHFAAIGLEKGDLSALLYPLGTMTGGILSYEALRIFGATPIPMAVFNTNQKIDMMKRFNVHHILSTPAYLTRITSILMEQGMDPKEEFPRLKGITLSTEPFSVPWALRMEEIWGAVLHDIYGSTQLNLNYAVTCKYGEWGEPVVTTFSRKAMPLIRFRSNDRVRLLPPGLCDCGRDCSAIWEVGTISRYDDMIKIKATNVWPQTVDEAVFSFEEIDEYNGSVYITDGGQEIAKVSVEFKSMNLDAKTKADILEKLSVKIKEATQVTMKLEEVPHGTLPRFEYKVRRWTDERVEGLERVKYIEK